MSSKILFSLLPCSRKEERDGTYRSSFLDNGSILLEDLIASCDGKSNPIRTYSADELIKATNNFDPSCIIQNCAGELGHKMFMGFLHDRSVIIKKFTGTGDEVRSLAIRDIVISTQMSNHNNVLKLLGCCLEFPIPALVHEYATKGALNDQGGFRVDEFLPWKTRLLIAKQLANALTYLHTAFSRPIIHRALTPRCIFLDHNYVPKLCNFSFSLTIPPGQSHAENNLKCFEHVDPVHMSSYITEKTDVCSFGLVLLILLTGREVVVINQDREFEFIISYVRLHACDGQIQKIVDPKIFEEVRGDEHAQQQLQAFLALALLCTEDDIEVRPYMIDVAKELVRIGKYILPC